MPFSGSPEFPYTRLARRGGLAPCAWLASWLARGQPLAGRVEFLHRSPSFLLSFVVIAAAAWTALAAWVSFGAIAFDGAARSTAPEARLGILPVDPVHLTLATLAAVVVLGIGLRVARATPQPAPLNRPSSLAIAVAPLGLLFLPWLPFPVPPAFLLWTGAWVSIVWIAVAIGLLRVATGWHPRSRVRAAAL